MSVFTLMGPIQSNAGFQNCPTDIFEVIKEGSKTKGLDDIKAFRQLPKPQKVELYNYTNFYSLRDLVFWHLLYGTGGYPSTLVHMARNFPLGKIVQNSMYMPVKPVKSGDKPAIMTFDRLVLSFPTKQVEWMEQPLYGGLVKDTMQAEYLLTKSESKLSHPYLQVLKEGKIRWKGSSWYYKYFVGTTPKDGVTGPGSGVLRLASDGKWSIMSRLCEQSVDLKVRGELPRELEGSLLVSCSRRNKDRNVFSRWHDSQTDLVRIDITPGKPGRSLATVMEVDPTGKDVGAHGSDRKPGLSFPSANQPQYLTQPNHGLNVENGKLWATNLLFGFPLRG